MKDSFDKSLDMAKEAGAREERLRIIGQICLLIEASRPNHVTAQACIRAIQRMK